MKNRIFIPGRIVPSITRNSTITPRYESYHESKISALSGASGSPFGGGTSRTIASSTSADALAGLGAGENRVVRFESDEVFDLFDRFLRFGARQIDLIDYRNQFEIVFDREVSVRERLRFDALRRIDDQQRAFTGRKRTRDFVGEIDVARRVDQIQHVLLAVRALCNRAGLRGT